MAGGMNSIETKQWKMTIKVDWVPKKPDKKITCSTCSGNGFHYTHNTTEGKPDVDQKLVLLLLEAFQKWKGM